MDCGDHQQHDLLDVVGLRVFDTNGSSSKFSMQDKLPMASPTQRERCDDTTSCPSRKSNGQACAQPMPIEMRSGVRLARWCDIGMANAGRNRVDRPQSHCQSAKRDILRICIIADIVAFKLDAD